jgi:activator of HSP90 ATPase
VYKRSMVSFRMCCAFPVPASTLYRAWLDAEQHSAMTGGNAECSDKIGAECSAWDGYISSRLLALEEGKRILLSWRTSEFQADDLDSVLSLLFEDDGTGGRVILEHTEIPDGQPDYEKGWEDYYFKPMRLYFVT